MLSGLVMTYLKMFFAPNDLSGQMMMVIFFLSQKWICFLVLHIRTSKWNYWSWLDILKLFQTKTVFGKCRCTQYQNLGKILNIKFLKWPSHDHSHWYQILSFTEPSRIWSNILQTHQGCLSRIWVFSRRPWTRLLGLKRLSSLRGWEKHFTSVPFKLMCFAWTFDLWIGFSQ